MNILSYKVFRDLVETRSFSKAAGLNAITQSAVSQQVASIEKRLKCALVQRGKREFAITAEGQLFYDGACKVLDAHEELLVKLQEMSHHVGGAVRVSTVYSIGLHELPAFLKRFMKQFPAVKVHVEYRRSNQVYDDVLQKAADVGLVAYPEKRTNIDVKAFRRDRLVLICHPHHRLASFRSLPIKQIVGQKFVGFDPDIPTHKALESIFKRHGMKVEHVMEFDNIETLKRAVEIDMGISMVPLSTVTQELHNGTLKVVEFTDEEIFRPLGILQRKGRALTPAIKAFLKVLESEPQTV